MAVKLILTQIMKDESHVAKRMLDSIKNIVDGICVVDTGSTDDSIEIVKNWGKENNVETYVIERPFDNFENSRNCSFEKAREKFLPETDDGNVYYNFWLDFDEQLIVDETFDKQSINKDLYMFDTYIGQMKYTRNELVRLDMNFKFYGPIHEYIIPPKDTKVTSDVLKGVKVDVKTDGASWQENIQLKYISHAHILEKYISENRTDSRWIFYTAQSYHDSSTITNIDERNERLRRAIRYYKERVERTDGYPEERFYSQFRIGTIMKRLEYPWNLTLQALLKAYSMEPSRGESIKVIIDYYLEMGEWDLAYMYSDFCVKNFHDKNPYPKRLLFVDNSLYTWKFLEVYSAACYYTGRKEEAKKAYIKMVDITNKSPEIFTKSDLSKIQTNKKFFIQ